MALPVAIETLADRLAAAGLSPTLAALTLAAAIGGAGALLGWAAQILVSRVLTNAAKRSKTLLDDLLVGAIRGPLVALGALWGAALGIQLSNAPDWVKGGARGSFLVVAGVALIVVAARLLGGMIAHYGSRARLEGPARAVVRRVSIAAVYVIGLLVILDAVGVSITPLLTTLGLAGLALALALQDTLSNFFAGIYVQADRPLDVGHYVRIEDGNIEGYVVEVGWRTTKVRTLGNNLIVIPNAKLAASVVTDYDLPEPRMSLLVGIPIARGTDSRRLEEILVEEAKKAAGHIPGLLATPEPFVRFIPGFTDHGLEFTLICQVQTFVDQYLAQHELRHRILSRLASEGIDVSVPYREIITRPARGAAELLP